MRRPTNIIRIFILLFTASVMGGVFCQAVPGNKVLDYKVLAIDTATWIVTAQEIETGNVVKFRMPPTLFKGQTFNAAINGVKPGQRFVARGPKNARLNRLVIENPLPQESRGPRTQRMRPGKRARLNIPFPKPLGWEILNVNPQQWVVTAKNRVNNRVIKFKVNPEGFIGFRFRANLRGVVKGKGFSIVAPNDVPFSNMCTLLE